jgi:hypothetical protein
MKTVVSCWLCAIVLVTGGDRASGQTVPLTAKKNVSIFSDNDERKGSPTTIKATLNDGVLSAAYRIDRRTDSRPVYAGFAIRLEQPPADDARSLSFAIKKDDKAVQPVFLTLQTSGGKRYRLDLAKYGTVDAQWKTIAIALDDFRLNPRDRSQIASLAVVLIDLPEESPVLSVDGSVSIKDVVFSTSAVASKTVLPDISFLEGTKVKKYQRGHAAWIYQESAEDVARILQHNNNNTVPIRLLFVYAGSLELEEQGGMLGTINVKTLKWFRDQLPTSVEVHACLDASGGRRLARYPLAEQERLAKAVAQEVNQVPFIQGLHLDIEPYSPDAVPFYIYLKKHLKKPLSAAVADWDPVLLKVLDYSVLMAYDLAPSPAGFQRAAAAKYRAFAEDARAAKSYYFLGVPFAATTLEHEYSMHRATGEKKASGFQMVDYTTAALNAFKMNEGIPQDPYFGGIAVWGFLDKNSKGVGGPAAMVGYYPHRIPDANWKLLEAFGK